MMIDWFWRFLVQHGNCTWWQKTSLTYCTSVALFHNTVRLRFRVALHSTTLREDKVCEKFRKKAVDTEVLWQLGDLTEEALKGFILVCKSWSCDANRVTTVGSSSFTQGIRKMVSTCYV